VPGPVPLADEPPGVVVEGVVPLVVFMSEVVGLGADVVPAFVDVARVVGAAAPGWH